jgi:hypothetical protein
MRISSGLLAAFAFLVALVVWRDPTLFTDPRFWAEEATVYFMTSCQQGFLAAMAAPHQGYFSLLVNLGGELATLPKLEYAPLMTTLVGLAVIVTIFMVVLFHEAEVLSSGLNKFIAGLAVVVVGTTGEIWLNATNCQHFMALLVFLVLIDSKRHPLKRGIGYGLVAIAGLTSVAANFLTPLFLVRYLQRREKGDLVLFIVLCLTSAVQLAMIIYSFIHQAGSSPIDSRFNTTFDLYTLVRQIALFAVNYPFFGIQGSWSWLVAGLFLLAVFLSMRRFPAHWEYPLAIVLLTVLSTLASLGMYGGPRYAYSASVIMMLYLLALHGDGEVPRFARYAALLLLASSLTYWSVSYRAGLEKYRVASWPSWKSEVQAWRLDKNRMLQVHPAGVRGADGAALWTMDLSQCRSVRE